MKTNKLAEQIIGIWWDGKPNTASRMRDLAEKHRDDESESISLNVPCHCEYDENGCPGIFNEIKNGTLICNECGMTINELIETITKKEFCKGIEIESGVFSGCDQSAGDCPICGK